jgi:hypothetical protein
MPRKSSNTRPSKPRKPAKKPATAGRKDKPWRTRARLDLLPLEPAVAKMLVQRTPDELIAAWVRTQAQYADVTNEQVMGLCDAIRARWAAVRDDPATVANERAVHAAMLDAAIHDAWNKPLMRFSPDEGMWVPVLNPDGTVAVQADHKALAAYLRERREFYGFGAPTKHLHLHGQAPPAVALSPADREAELRELMARRNAALAAQGQVIDVPARALPAGVAKK